VDASCNSCCDEAAAAWLNPVQPAILNIDGNVLSIPVLAAAARDDEGPPSPTAELTKALASLGESNASVDSGAESGFGIVWPAVRLGGGCCWMRMAADARVAAARASKPSPANT
jgi:hypothetical protein